MNKIQYTLIPVALMLTLAGCGNHADEQGAREKQGPKEVSVVRSKKREYHPRLTYGGTAYAFKEANLGTALPGRVEKLHYEEGEKVKAGALLVELSAELYAQALAEKNTLEKDFERISRLKEKGSVTQQKYDHIKAKYEAAKAKARMMRKNCRIRAPFSGTVVDYLVKEGENFLFSPSLKSGYSHTSGIVQLMQLNRLKIEADVNEKDLPRISEGQEARLSFDAYPDTTIKGTVTHIDPILSTATHSGKIEVTVNNRGGILKPGMYAGVSIRLPKTSHVFVPLKAVFRQPGTGNDFVFVVENSKAIKQPVKKLSTQGDQVAVRGIRENIQVVVHGKNKLNNGDPVTVTGTPSEKQSSR